MFHILAQAVATDHEPYADLEFEVLIDDDLSVATDDPIATSLLDTFMEESRPIIISAYYLTEENPDIATVSTWVAIGHHIEGWSQDTQEEIADLTISNPFDEGLMINGSAWPAKYGGQVV